MASSTKTFLTLALLATARLAAGHSAIISAVGDAGGIGMGLGVDTSTPRDGTSRRPFQQDATRFRGDAEATVGETLAGGDNNVEAGTQAIMAEMGDVLPQVTAGGELQMTLHQVNSDGAGPYTCMINADGTAASWTNIPVTQDVPGGRNSRNRDGEQTDFPLTAAIPAGQTCTGTVAGQDNVCLVRCENGARAGPFGGVVPVQMAAAAGAGGANGGNANGDAAGDATGNGNGNADNANGNANGNGNNGNANGNANGGNANGDAAGNATGNGNANNNNNAANDNANANDGTCNCNAANDTGADNNINANTNSRRALARKVKDSEMKLARLRKRAIALAEDLGDADVLAEVMDECEE